MSDKTVWRYCARNFTAHEIELIRTLAASGVARTKLSRILCEKLQWRKPDGGLKDMSARIALLRMHRDGLIELPAPLHNYFRPGRIKPLEHSAAADPPALLPIPDNLDAVRPLHFQVVTGTPHGKLWREFVQRYHYLGYSPLPGAQMRYVVRSCAGEPLAMLGFGAAAWKTAPRDTFIGWVPECRQRNLPLVVNNARFLILPWIRIPNLASHILARCEKQLLQDWPQRYALRPVLLETFCEIPRFAGTCYRAANWTCVGQTKGRGKLDVHNLYALPIKDIWLRPLQRNWKKILNL